MSVEQRDERRAARSSPGTAIRSTQYAVRSRNDRHVRTKKSRSNPSQRNTIPRMSSLPKDSLAIIDEFGPHLAFSQGARLDPGVEPDRLVKTHCCFCGQQCGVQLKVKENTV